MVGQGRVAKTGKTDGFHHGDLHNALVAAAVSLLESKDASSLSLREVARLAGVSSGAPYHHFATRADLLLAVALQGFVALGQAIDEAERSTSRPAVRLERRIAAYMRFALAHPGHYRVMFHEELRTSSSASDFDAVARASFEALVDSVAGVRPDLGRDRARLVAFTVWSAAHGAAMLEVDGLGQALGVVGRDGRSLVVESTARNLRLMVEHGAAAGG